MDKINIRRGLICGVLWCAFVVLLIWRIGGVHAAEQQTRAVIITAIATIFCTIWAAVSTRWNWFRHIGTLFLVYYIVKRLTDYIPVPK